MAEPSEAQLEAAEMRGRRMLETEPRAMAVRYDRAAGRIEIDLANGCSFAFPTDAVQDLHGAAPADLATILIDGHGFNLHWPKLEVDLFVPGLIAGVFGTRQWLAREIARTAGRTKSPAKSAAARSNGMKGGRPRKRSAG